MEDIKDVNDLNNLSGSEIDDETNITPNNHQNDSSYQVINENEKFNLRCGNLSQCDNNNLNERSQKDKNKLNIENNLETSSNKKTLKKDEETTFNKNLFCKDHYYLNSFFTVEVENEHFGLGIDLSNNLGDNNSSDHKSSNETKSTNYF